MFETLFIDTTDEVITEHEKKLNLGGSNKNKIKLNSEEFKQLFLSILSF